RGTCSLAITASTAGGDDARMGFAVALGMCHDTNGTCEGSFRIHVDSNRDTLGDCHSDGNGFCSGRAAPEGVEVGGDAEDDKTVLHLHTKAPGGEDTKDCSNAAPCQYHWSDELDRKYMGISRDTEKSVGGFFKNLARDGGYVIVHAVPGFVGAVATELWSWVTFAPWGEGLDGYAQNRPLTGGIAKGAVGFKERWLDGDGDKIGDDYYFAPVSTALEDVGTVALLAFGAGAILKGISLGAKGLGTLAKGSAATVGVRGMVTSMGTKAGVWAPRVNAAGNRVLLAANKGGHVAMLPLKINLTVGRFVLGKGMVAVAPRMATRAAAGASALVDRGVGALENGRTDTGFRHLGAADLLNRAAGGLRAGAPAGLVVQRGGILGRITFGGRHLPGLISTIRAYDRLGLQFGRTLTPDQVTAAYRGAVVGAHTRDAVGTPTGLARIVGPERATALRLPRIDRAVRIVRLDQVLRERAGPGRTVGEPPPRTSIGTDPLAGSPRARAIVDDEVATRGFKFFRSADKRAAFLRMGPEERARFVDDQQWTKAVLGFAIERMGLPLVQAELRPGEQAFMNVQVEFVGKGGRSPFPDLDFLVVDGARVTRLISAKGGPNSFKAARERGLLWQVVEGIPTDAAALKAWLRNNPRANLGDAFIDSITGVQVRVNGGGPIPLARFRARYLRDTVVSEVRIDSLTPKNPLATGLVLEITREQLVDAIVVAIQRRITGIDGPDGPAGGVAGPPPGPRGGDP
ncbi:MAG: hypothetical protein L0H84_20745, partial [Pseudonocardia sp.]|nr:hypothetical protein [Pseudonocardia sp.]